MAGRDVSITHEALGTARLMRTGGLMGEVVGLAAKLCIQHAIEPYDVYEDQLDEFKALLSQGENVVGVITVEDVPNQKYPNPGKECAIDNDIELYQANYLKKAEAIDWVKELEPDLHKPSGRPY